MHIVPRVLVAEVFDPGCQPALLSQILIELKFTPKAMFGEALLHGPGVGWESAVTVDHQERALHASPAFFQGFKVFLGAQ
jgi:hypothetical protein